jgi:cyclophilin family peptidyl-prolyl cis-trans isomerase
MANTKVQMQTTLGDILIELDNEAAPVSVNNFLEYVNDGYFAGTIFHRVISGFMIQGGGMTKTSNPSPASPAHLNEASNASKTTAAPSRWPALDPDCATRQFFINHKDNDFLNYRDPRLTQRLCRLRRSHSGMEVVDKIAAVKTTRNGFYDTSPPKP